MINLNYRRLEGVRTDRHFRLCLNLPQNVIVHYENDNAQPLHKKQRIVLSNERDLIMPTSEKPDYKISITLYTAEKEQIFPKPELVHVPLSIYYVSGKTERFVAISPFIVLQFTRAPNKYDTSHFEMVLCASDEKKELCSRISVHFAVTYSSLKSHNAAKQPKKESIGEWKTKFP